MVAPCLRRAAFCALAALSPLALAQPLPPLSQRGAAEPGPPGPLMPGVDLTASTALLDDPVAHTLSGSTLQGLQGGARRTTRGVAASEIYRRLAPAVVLVAVRSGGLGTGSLLDTRGSILTNWHVIRGHSEASIVFKPQEEGSRISSAQMLRARVVRVDEVADLALLQVDQVPAGVQPMPLGQPQDLQVGADVHAIGHPAGQQWTYTRGVISQRRLGYEWSDDIKQHVANVVQTQTPINPGNSGGPLISDEGRLIGINTFKLSGKENLNFAISVDEVLRFLEAGSDRLAANTRPRTEASNAAPPCTTQRETARGRSPDGRYDYVSYDLGCHGRSDMEIRLPVDTTQPMTAVFDRNGDGKVDLIVFSPSRNGQWTLSYHDNDFDGQWDLVGHHPDGKMLATRFESYAVWVAGKGR